MSGQETPNVTANSKKRELSSPEFADSKKNKPASSSSISDLDISDTLNSEEESSVMADHDTLGASQIPSTSHITIPPSEMLKLSEMLKDTFRGEIVNLVDSVVQGVLKGLNDRIASLEEKNRNLESQNKALVTRVKTLESAAEQAEQYSRRNCLRISGIDEVYGENTDDIVLKMASDIGSDIQINDIDRSHRIGKPNAQRIRPREVIVKFATFRARQKLFKMKKALKDNGYTGVFLNEDLTKIRNQVVYEARQVVKADRAKGAWTSDGIILIRDFEEQVHRVTCSSDITAIDFPSKPIDTDELGPRG